MTDAATIAKGLTKAQRKAIVNANQVGEIFDTWCEASELSWLDHEALWRLGITTDGGGLTVPLGLEVRRLLQAHEGASDNG